MYYKHRSSKKMLKDYIKINFKKESKTLSGMKNLTCTIYCSGVEEYCNRFWL